MLLPLAFSADLPPLQGLPPLLNPLQLPLSCNDFIKGDVSYRALMFDGD